MKKAIFYSMMLVIGFAACKKETSIESGSNASGNFTATIDGTKWAASSTKQAASILGGISYQGWYWFTIAFGIENAVGSRLLRCRN